MRVYKLAAALACLLVAGTASAQDKNAAFGFQIERFEPTLAGESTFGVERPWYSSERWFAADITLDTGHNPAWIGTNRGGGDTAIDNQFVGRLNLAASFLDRFVVGIALPMTLYESGHDLDGAGPLGPNGSVGFGDPRVSAMMRLWGHSDRSAISLHIGADVWFPRFGSNANQLGHDGDAGMRVMPKLVLAGRVAHVFRWAFNIGYYWRDDAKYTTLPTSLDNIVGDEVRAAAEVAYTSRDNRFNFGPEVWISSHALNDKFLQSTYTSVELIVAIHYLFADMIRAGFGVSYALAQDIGTPQARLLFRLAYAPVRKKRVPPPIAPPPPPPPPPDRDHDGVLDADDVCPDEPAGAHPDPKRKGCPAHDSDGDGVLDYEDQCVDTPAGPHPDPNKKGCPAMDTDGDGVFDYEDECPQVPAGAHPDAKRKGCPTPDRDGDTVTDDVDACPDVPGAPSPDPKKNGCPGLVEVKNGVIVIFQPVFFATNKDTILAKSFPVLNAVADALKAEPEIKKVMIEGHTDNRGKKAHNMDLSDRRARSVMNYLIGRGIDAERLASQGFGDTKPVESNSTASGRAANRRVEFHIIDPAPPAPAQP